MRAENQEKRNGIAQNTCNEDCEGTYEKCDCIERPTGMCVCPNFKVNSLTPMDTYICAQLFNELRDRLITFLLFVR